MMGWWHYRARERVRALTDAYDLESARLKEITRRALTPFNEGERLEVMDTLTLTQEDQDPKTY